MKKSAVKWKSSFVLCLAIIPLVSCSPSDPGIGPVFVPPFTADPHSGAPPPTSLPSSSTLASLPPSPAGTLTPPARVSSSASPSQTPSFDPTSLTTQEPAFPPTSYYLEIILNYDLHQLQVEQKVSYRNVTGEALPELVFVVEPNRWPSAFHLMRLEWQDGSPVEAYTLQDNLLRISLDPTLPAGESVILSLSYELSLPPISPPSDTVRPMPFGYTSRQTNLVDFYPMLPPHNRGQGWLVHDPWYFGEHLVNDVASYQVKLEVVSYLSGIEVAASALPERDGGLYHYRLEAARSFALSASHQYLVLSRQAGDVTVYSYAFPFHQEPAEAALNDTFQALALYSQLFGSYPHASLSLVEADFLDGMEYDGLFFLSRGFYNLYEGNPQGYLTTIAVHETAHQWWYALVGNDQALEPWLDEALCTYSELLFYEHYYPELVNWWWSFRVYFHRPAGWVDSSIYQVDGFRPYVDAVYLRGSLFMQELRSAIGDQSFFAFLKDYAGRNRYALATSADFFSLLSEYTQQDLQPVVDPFFNALSP